MGLALLYPTSSSAYETIGFCDLQSEVDRYMEKLEKTNSNDRDLTFIPEEEQNNRKNNCIEYRKDRDKFSQSN